LLFVVGLMTQAW